MISNLYCQAFSIISGGHCTLHFSEIVWVGLCHSSGTAVACSLTEQCKNTCPCVGCHNASVCYHCTKKRDCRDSYINIKRQKKSSGRVLKLVNKITSADFLFMTSTWRNSEPNTSPRIYRYFMFIIQTVVFSLFFHTLPNLCISWFTKEKTSLL